MVVTATGSNHPGNFHAGALFQSGSPVVSLALVAIFAQNFQFVVKAANEDEMVGTGEDW